MDLTKHKEDFCSERSCPDWFKCEKMVQETGRDLCAALTDEEVLRKECGGQRTVRDGYGA